MCAALCLAGCADKAQPRPDASELWNATAGADARSADASSAPMDANDAHVGAPDARPASQGGEDAQSGGHAAEPPPDSGGADAAQDASVVPAVKSLSCAPGQSYGDPLPSDRNATKVMQGFGFLEGPVWIPKLGVLLFSDMDFSTSNAATGPNAKLRRFTPPNKFDVLVEMSGTNGMSLDNEGLVLAATHDVQSLSRFDPMTGARESLALRYQGKHFNSPNDVCVRSDGNVYFSDPDWQLGSRSSETGIRGLYRVAPDGTVSLISSALNRPNGVALSPDERTLYVGSQDQEVLAYPLDAAGQAGTSKTFATTGSSDGMTVDCAGNIYVCSGTMEVFSSTGKKLGEISVAEEPSNVAFGGPTQRTLYITAKTGLYSIELNVPGRAY
jgi:gluconolactonase